MAYEVEMVSNHSINIFCIQNIHFLHILKSSFSTECSPLPSSLDSLETHQRKCLHLFTNSNFISQIHCPRTQNCILPNLDLLINTELLIPRHHHSKEPNSFSQIPLSNSILLAKGFFATLPCSYCFARY